MKDRLYVEVSHWTLEHCGSMLEEGVDVVVNNDSRDRRQ